MRTAEDRAALRAKRASDGKSKPETTTYPGTAAALRLLGYEVTAQISRAGVVTWSYPQSAAADAERYSYEARRTAGERWQLIRDSPHAVEETT